MKNCHNCFYITAQKRTQRKCSSCKISWVNEEHLNEECGEWKAKEKEENGK